MKKDMNQRMNCKKLLNVPLTCAGSLLETAGRWSNNDGSQRDATTDLTLQAPPIGRQCCRSGPLAVESVISATSQLPSNKIR
jgi:hypothetical protein